jgi:hypothetical protein
MDMYPIHLNPEDVSRMFLQNVDSQSPTRLWVSTQESHSLDLTAISVQYKWFGSEDFEFLL